LFSGSALTHRMLFAFQEFHIETIIESKCKKITGYVTENRCVQLKMVIRFRRRNWSF